MVSIIVAGSSGSVPQAGEAGQAGQARRCPAPQLSHGISKSLEEVAVDGPTREGQCQAAGGTRLDTVWFQSHQQAMVAPSEFIASLRLFPIHVSTRPQHPAPSTQHTVHHRELGGLCGWLSRKELPTLLPSFSSSPQPSLGSALVLLTKQSADIQRVAHTAMLPPTHPVVQECKAPMRTVMCLANFTSALSTGWPSLRGKKTRWPLRKGTPRHCWRQWLC